MQNQKLKKLLAAATNEERHSLAEAGGVKLTYLYSLANGKREAKARLAGKIVEAADELRAVNPLLPKITRGDISPACRACPHYIFCKEIETNS